MKHLHITNTEKFVEPYIKFITSKFDSNEHKFFCFKNSITDYIKGSYINLFKFDKVAWNLKVLKELYATDRIYLHGLFDMRIVLLLFFQPWLLKKCFWIVWGADLYSYRQPRFTLKAKIKEYSRRFVIKRIGGLITHIKGDYELAKEWYGIRGEYYYSFIYPSNLYKEILIFEKIKDDTVTYIQVGNSADPSNNHLQIFEKLSLLNPKNVHIICPLSYGDKEYTEKIVKSGKALFGDSFEPLLEFMPFDNYLEVLSKIDVAIFNHNRQQAVGNITTLLGLGKKVYMRDDITTWEFCKEHDLKVFSITKDIDSVLIPINETDRVLNISNSREQFSEIKLVKDWEYIFNSEKSSRREKV